VLDVLRRQIILDIIRLFIILRALVDVAIAEMLKLGRSNKLAKFIV
jgi:hypothetical protein